MSLIIRDLARLETLDAAGSLPGKYSDYVKRCMEMYQEEIEKIPKSLSDYSEKLIMCQTWTEVNVVNENRDRSEFGDIKADDYFFDLMNKIDEKFGKNLEPYDKFLYNLKKKEAFDKFTEHYFQLFTKYPVDEVKQMIENLAGFVSSVQKDCQNGAIGTEQIERFVKELGKLRNP